MSDKRFSISKLMIVAVIIFFTYTGLLATKSIVGFPTAMRTGMRWPYLCDKPVGEDGYYMLTAAWNLAHDGKLACVRGQTTTGIQPLSTAMFAAIALGVQFFQGGRWLYIRLVLLFGALTAVCFAYIVARIANLLAAEAHKDAAADVAFVLALYNFTLFRIFAYGLETGMYLVLFGLCVLYSIQNFRNTSRESKTLLVFGALVGATGLARIDFGVVFAVFLFCLLIARRIKHYQAVICGAVALTMVSPWFVFVHHVSNTWMPSSGTAESNLITGASAFGRIGVEGLAIVSQLTPWSYSGAPTFFILVGALPLGVFLALLFRYQRQIRDSVGASFHVLGAWCVAILFLSAVYVGFFGSTYFYVRYTAPLAVLSIPVLAVVGTSWPSARRSRFVFLGFAAVWFCGWAIVSLHSGRIGNTHTVSAGYLRTHFPNVPVGAFQSGVIGFFNPNVVNLDGKVNSDALRALRTGTMDHYIDSMQLRVITDWPGYISSNLPRNYLRSSWKPCPEPVNNGITICLMRISEEDRIAGNPSETGAP